MREKKLDPIIAIAFVVIFLVILAFNVLSPIVSDDYAFCFGIDDKRISSFSSIFEALKQHRQNTNGRVFAHFFVYLFLWLPRSVFAVVNTAFCLLCIWFLYCFFRSEETARNRLLLATALCMLWYFLPGLGHVLFWLTGSCNYLWGMVLFLLFLYQFYCVYFERPCTLAGTRGVLLQGILCIPAAFLTGAYSENGSLSVLFILVCMFILMILGKKKIPVSMGITFVFLIAGFLFLMLAPSELHGRAGDTSLKSLFDSAKACVLTTKRFCLGLLAIYMAVLILSIVKKTDYRKILFSAVLVTGGLVSIAVFVFALYLPPRSFHVLVMNTTLGTVLLLDELWKQNEKTIPSILCGGMVALFAFSFVLATGDIVSLSLQADQREKMITEAIESGEKDITLPKLISSTSYTAVVEEELSTSPDDWYNGCIASYYGLDSITAEIKVQQQ